MAVTAPEQPQQQPAQAPPPPPPSGGQPKQSAHALFRALSAASVDATLAHEASEESREQAGRNISDLVNARCDALQAQNDNAKTHMGDRFDTLKVQTDARFDTMQGQIDGVKAHADERFDSLKAHTDERFNSVDVRFDGVQRQIDAMQKQTEAIQAQTAAMQKQIDVMQARSDERFDGLEKLLGSIRRNYWTLFGVLTFFVTTLLGLIYEMLTG